MSYPMPRTNWQQGFASLGQQFAGSMQALAGLPEAARKEERSKSAHEQLMKEMKDFASYKEKVKSEVLDTVEGSDAKARMALEIDQAKSSDELTAKYREYLINLSLYEKKRPPRKPMWGEGSEAYKKKVGEIEMDRRRGKAQTALQGRGVIPGVAGGTVPAQRGPQMTALGADVGGGPVQPVQQTPPELKVFGVEDEYEGRAKYQREVAGRLGEMGVTDMPEDELNRMPGYRALPQSEEAEAEQIFKLAGQKAGIAATQRRLTGSTGSATEKFDRLKFLEGDVDRQQKMVDSLTSQVNSIDNQIKKIDDDISLGKLDKETGEEQIEGLEKKKKREILKPLKRRQARLQEAEAKLYEEGKKRGIDFAQAPEEPTEESVEEAKTIIELGTPPGGGTPERRKGYVLMLMDKKSQELGIQGWDLEAALNVAVEQTGGDWEKAVAMVLDVMNAKARRVQGPIAGKRISGTEPPVPKETKEPEFAGSRASERFGGMGSSL